VQDNVTSLGRTTVNAPIMLVVGDLRGWEKSGRTPPDLKGFHFADFCDVTAEMLAEVRPDVVISALFAPDFDVLDLARKLVDLGFKGRYRALSAALPNPSVIRTEVAAAAPGIDFDLFVFDETGMRPARK
jgi:hypothetical protein